MTAQELVDLLQDMLGLQVRTGQITLNLSERRLQSFESRTYGKVKSEDDRRAGLAERRSSGGA